MFAKIFAAAIMAAVLNGVSPAHAALTPADLVLNGGGGNVTLALPAISAVPEPQAYALLTAGLGLFGFLPRRRRP